MKALIDDARTFHSRPRLAMLVVPSLSFFIAIFIVYPLASQVVIQLVCDNMYRDDAESKDCSSVEVSRQAALVTLYCELAINIPAFFSSGLYGKACDKYGRRLVMLISLYGFMGYLVCLLSITYFEALSGSFLYFLLAGYFFFGVLGSNTAFQVATYLPTYLLSISCGDYRCRWQHSCTLPISLKESHLQRGRTCTACSRRACSLPKVI